LIVLDLLLLVSTAAFILGGSAVGIRLLALAWRTREVTDFAIAFALFELAGIAYPLILIAGVGGHSLAVARALAIAVGFAMAVGFSGVFVFTQRAFRPRDPWARVLAALGIATLFSGAIASAIHARHTAVAEAFRTVSAEMLWIQIAATSVYLWTSIEGVRCWIQARRRLAIGLADPLVDNRFALWALVGACSLISMVPSLALLLAGRSPLDYPLLKLNTAVAGIGTTFAMQLAFLPPAAYRRWVAARAAA
jgi:hypothetical protein